MLGFNEGSLDRISDAVETVEARTPGVEREITRFFDLEAGEGPAFEIEWRVVEDETVMPWLLTMRDASIRGSGLGGFRVLQWCVRRECKGDEGLLAGF